MFVYKKLKPSDVSITPFEAHKQYTYDSSSAGNNGITFNTALWTSESKAHYSANNLAGNFQNHRNYFQFDKVFYRDYILDNANLIPDVNYIKQEKRLYDKVNILSIPQNLFGNRIQPTTFNLTGNFNGSSTSIQINDDGEGNIYPSTYTLGTTNWPSEKRRVVYIGPVKGFKKKDLNTIPGTGNTLVNQIDSFTLANVYDDSYYINQVDYNKVTFNGNTPLTFINTGVDGHLRLDHDTKYNFGFDEDFNISFYFKTSEIDSQRVSGSADNGKYYFIAKSDIKTIVPNPGGGQSETLSTFTSGNLQTIDVPAENKYPFKLYYTDNVDETGSLFFERSNGSLTSFVSTSLFYSGSTNEIIHISAQKSGNELQLWINGVKTVSGSDINPVVCKDQPPTNEANLYIGSRGNIDSYLNSNLSQIMIWNEALSETQIRNVSQSITGTPYIGNIFYDEGFVTINHPSYSDILQQYSGSSQTITLDPTYGDIYNHDVRTLAFTNPTYKSPVITFYNESAKFWFDPTSTSVNDTTLAKGLINGWYTFSPQLETNLGITNILAIKDEVLRLDFMTASVFNVDNNTQQPFTPSGSNNSITPGSLPYGDPTAANYAFLSSSILETKANVNILFASNSQEIASEIFPSTDTSITDTVFEFGDTNPYINDGGEYVNNVHPAYGYLMISGSINNSGYFQGQLISPIAGAGVANNTFANESYNSIDFSSAKNLEGDPRIVPDGIINGADYNIIQNHIEILQNPPSQLIFQLSGSLDNIDISGTTSNTNVSVRVRKTTAGGTTNTEWQPLYNVPIGSDTSFDFGTYYLQAGPSQGEQAITAALGDKFTVEVKISTNGTLNSYQAKNIRLKIIGEAGSAFSEGFKNKLVIQHKKTSPKANSIYSYNLQGIITRPGAGGSYDTEFSNNNTTGLSQDINGNEVGVRVSLLQGANIITSSFYPSSSGETEKDFNYEHFTGTNTNTLKLLVYPSIVSSTEASYTGEAQGFFIGSLNSGDKTFSLVEKSGSNELHLDTDLIITDPNFNNSSYDPIITFTNDLGLINSSNPVSINSFNGSNIIVANNYLITGSLPATASYFVKQKISASAELEIVTSSLLTIENFYLGSGSDSFYSSSLTTNNGVPRVRIYSGSNLVNTSVGSVDGTGYLIIENQHLGYFASGSTLGIHLDVVDSTSPSTAITSSEGEGYSIDNLQITGISSSITISRNEDWALDFNPNTTHIQFTSPMGSVGDSNLPFSTGNITASVNYINSNTLTLDAAENLLFTTNSVSVKMIASSSTGFPIRLTWNFEGKGNGSIYEYFEGTVPYQFLDIIKTDGDTDDNEGLTLFIYDNSNNLLVTSSYINSASLATENLVIPNFTSSVDGIFTAELRTTNSESVDIPVTWDIGLSGFITNYNNWEKEQPKNSPVITELSSSYVSNKLLSSSIVSLGGVGNENMFKIISSHNNVGQYPNSPFTTGIHETQGSFLQTPINSLLYNIVLDSPLFITASSNVSGGYSQLQYFLTQESQSATSLPSPLLEGNFSIGNNTYNIESINGNSFIIDTPLLLTGSTNVTLNYHTTASNDFTVKFKNSHLIFEHEYQCSVDEEEYNYTQNISVKKNKSNQSSDLADCLTGSIDNSQITLFKPYVTTVGLYDDNYNLLAVGKFAQPIKMSEETDMTFVIRWDS